MKKVVVVGAGTMGNGIAQVFAMHGTTVRMVDHSANALDGGMAAIKSSLGRLVKKGVLTAERVGEVMGRVEPASTLDGMGTPELLIEAVSERRELKYTLFEQFDAACPPGTILATNTSSISITEIAARTKRPDKVIGMHFMNPVPVMKLVEIIRGQATSDETCRAVVEASAALDKTPVLVNDYPGFVSNRVLMPMINEAIFCVMEGVATPEAIDTVMKLGMAHPMGPLALADLIGL
ncbi:MAG TPA: 3-hydroxyacyl-CoA dehydrogenase NAD-binding domain-containing protein, partial [Gemmatimonadales bacterium]|nr:3-hydroxyacyl-CoA dehydrogenase NAD-binding domain-containing protein [Gemmatimonadales bacterium]